MRTRWKPSARSIGVGSRGRRPSKWIPQDPGPAADGPGYRAVGGSCDMEANYIREDVPGGVPVEDEARRQLANAARLPIVFKHIAAMPDVHFGIGATVGSVIPTFKAIIPAAVGVDIGCGMMAAKTTLRAEDLDETSLKKVFSQIERDVPVGFDQHKDRDVR